MTHARSFALASPLARAGGAVGLGCVAALLGWAVGWLGDPNSWRLQLFWATLFAAGCTGWLLRRRLMASPQATLWFFNIFVGIALIGFVPPIASVAWDGQTHFSAALALSQGPGATYNGADVIMTNRDGIYEVGLIPQGTSEDDWHPNWELILTNEGFEHQLDVLLAAKTEGKPVHREGFWRLGDSGAVPMGYSVSQLARGPMALGLWLGRSLELPLFATYALGRIANFGLWCLLSWIALGRLKSGRWLFVAICLLPTQLFIACNWSYDPWVVGMASIATTSLLGELERADEPLGLSGALWMLIPWYLATAVKAIFFAWALVFFFLPRAKFATAWARWLWWAAWGALIAQLLVGFMTPFIASQGATNVDTQSVSNVRPWDQLQLMAREPWRYALALALTTLDYVNPWRIFCDVPVDLCYLPRPVGWEALAAGELGILAWLTLADRSQADQWAKTRAGRRLRVSAVVGFVIAFGALLTALYVSYNEVGSTYILGMQARYYLMYLPLLLGVVLCGDGAGLVAWLYHRLPKRWQARLGERLNKRQGECAPHEGDPVERAIFALPHRWWIEQSPRSRQLLVASEALLLACFLFFGFVVRF